MDSPASDTTLCARAVSGDRHAFAILVRRHQSIVRGLLRRLCGPDRALADDLAQETFVRAFSHLAEFRGTAKLSSWLFRIAYNVFLDQRHRHKELFDEALVAEALAPATNSDVLLSQSLERAMAALRVEERMALALCFGHDLSAEEAAAVMDCPTATVKTHLLRGKEKLRARMKTTFRGVA